MNRKGQALVEFVLILPVFLMILFAIVDFGMILSSKSKLENTSTDLVMLILNGETVSSVSREYSDLEIDVKKYNDKYQKVIIIQNVKLITPFLDRVLGNPFQIKVERVIPNA